MTLATHAVVGASLAQFFPNHPVAAFCIGFASHFVLDAIPHWDYHLESSHEDGANPLKSDIVMGPALVRDLFKIGFDGLLGIALSLAFFASFQIGASHALHIVSLLCGAIGAMTPDFLQFVYFRFRHEPLTSLQRFHMWIHARLKLNDIPAAGATLQAIFAIIIVLITRVLA
jgi:hypothetical protein